MTGAADQTCRLWDCETGKLLSVTKTETAVRTALFSYCGNLIFYTTDQAMKKPFEMTVVDIRTQEKVFNFTNPTDQPKEKPSASLWGPLDETLITGHDNGMLTKWDLRNVGEKLIAEQLHKSTINDMQFNKEQTMFITASKDTTAKLVDSDTLQHLKTYKTGRPVNSAAISPIRDHVVLGGGQEAMSVTTTDARQGQFQAKFFHLVFEEEFAGVKGHFGPINSLAFHPDGKSFSTGGEDGFVRIQSFDQEYFEFKFDF